jgi:BirA family biotin operon repressor/biotin-[acetyl-CoA-carboxylase] ligase
MYSQRELPGYQSVRHYASVSSTMDVAREMIASCAELAPSWSGLVTADQQSAGRGRQGRSWLSGERAFMGTFVFCTSWGLSDFAGYSLSVGYALAAAFERFDIRFSLKWPNDLVVVQAGELRKLGGILIEVEEVGDIRCILVGIGINLSAPPDVFQHLAVAIDEITQVRLTPEQVTAVIAEALLRAHNRFFEGQGVAVRGFESTRQEWESYSCFVPGQTEVTLEVGGTVVSGRYTGVTSTGALRLVFDDRERVFHSGHIVSVRL